MPSQTVLTERKKRGPEPTGKGQLVGVRVQPADLKALDAFIASRPDPKPSRPEAVREMIRVVLSLLDAGNAAVKRELS